MPSSADVDAAATAAAWLLVLRRCSPRSIAAAARCCRSLAACATTVTLERQADCSGGLEPHPIPYVGRLPSGQPYASFTYLAASVEPGGLGALAVQGGCTCLLLRGTACCGPPPTRSAGSCSSCECATAWSPEGNYSPTGLLLELMPSARGRRAATRPDSEPDAGGAGGTAADATAPRGPPLRLPVITTAPFLRECGAACPCLLSACANRVTQRGVRLPLRIQPSPVAPGGWGLFAGAPIPQGAFVCVYAGQLITQAEKRLRRSREAPGSSSYLLTAREVLPSGRAALVFTVDPREVGSVGRFANHACGPPQANLEPKLTRRAGRLVPEVAFFAGRDVGEGEELMFTYAAAPERAAGLRSGEGPTSSSLSPTYVQPPDSDATVAAANGSWPCRCGAPACTGAMPVESISDW